MVRLSCVPEGTPTPVTVACERSVVCRLNFIDIRPRPHLDHPAVRTCAPTQFRGIPKSRQTIITDPESANSRFFTDCYPSSAVFAPGLNQIGTRPLPPVTPIEPRKE